mmetsp:Transcript_14339/g.40819  ORF Transcript_14339/g.40819 Transcript_14339/m.40819 type:complete len:122 (-) Transcript_14339:122-487(-)
MPAAPSSFFASFCRHGILVQHACKRIQPKQHMQTNKYTCMQIQTHTYTNNTGNDVASSDACDAVSPSRHPVKERSENDIFFRASERGIAHTFKLRQNDCRNRIGMNVAALQTMWIVWLFVC